MDQWDCLFLTLYRLLAKIPVKCDPNVWIGGRRRGRKELMMTTRNDQGPGGLRRGPTLPRE